VPGELYIGGVGVGRGYHNRPGLTAEKFVPNALLSSVSPQNGYEKGGERLYKTGDLARYLPDSSIEFLGRLDYQVKVRGFRIELGEIESALSQHPALRESAVVAHKAVRTAGVGGASESSRLVAYIVTQSGSTPTVNELRRFLQLKLPDYMIPAVFVTLEALPLTPSGKVNRRALPEPDTTRPILEQAFVAPRTPEEKELAAIWTFVLNLEKVGIHDNFFALGGDSILSIQILAQARQRGLNFTLQQLFQHPTIQELAQEIGKAESSVDAPEQVEPFGLLADKDRARLEALKQFNPAG
jgi:aryl carrier-like protein